MSLNNANEKCAVCSAYLFEEDDIVYCPECGAPHHRECYNSVGRCGLEEFHGTDKQYERLEPNHDDEKERPIKNDVTICRVCGQEYDPQEFVCPHCQTPNMAKSGAKIFTFDFLGGIPADTDLGNGVTAGDAKNFVISNTHRYIPKFLKFKQGKKLSWNWLALITPCGWLMSRKMYLLGAIIGALQIAFTLLSAPLEAVIYELTPASVSSMELANILLENMANIDATAIYAAAIGGFANIVIRIVIALFGDFIYRNQVISKVSEIKRESEDQEADFRKKGGISFMAALIGYFSVLYLPTIISYTLGII